MPRWSKKRQTSLYTDCLRTTNITNDVYNDIAGNVEKWFDMSSYDKIKRKRLLTAKKNKNKIGILKGKMGGKMITKSAASRPKTYCCKLQKGDYDLEDSEYIKDKKNKQSASKEQ